MQFDWLEVNWAAYCHHSWQCQHSHCCVLCAPEARVWHRGCPDITLTAADICSPCGQGRSLCLETSLIWRSAVANSAAACRHLPGVFTSGPLTRGRFWHRGSPAAGRAVRWGQGAECHHCAAGAVSHQRKTPWVPSAYCLHSQSSSGALSWLLKATSCSAIVQWGSQLPR